MEWCKNEFFYFRKIQSEILELLFSVQHVALLKKHVQLIVLRNQVPFTTKHFVQIEKNRKSHVNAKHRLVIINGTSLNGANAQRNAVKECRLDKSYVANLTELPLKNQMMKVNVPKRSHLQRKNVL